MREKEEIVLRLSEAQLNVVLQHLGVGRYCDVFDTLFAVTSQASPQIAMLAQTTNAQTVAMEEAAAPVKN